MGTKTIMIAALAAAPLAAAGPAQAAEPALEQPAQPRGLDEGVQLSSREGPAASASETAPQAEAPRKKRKSTGDKVLTGAAIALGIGALAVGGLLIAIFAG
jgi:hypothetical protein